MFRTKNTVLGIEAADAGQTAPPAAPAECATPEPPLKRGTLLFERTLANIPKDARTVAAFDIGERNMGACLYDVANDRMLLLEWLDVARHPADDAESMDMIGVNVGQLVRQWPQLLEADLWLLEQQPIMPKDGGLRVRNTLIENAMIMLCEVHRIAYVRMNPGAIRRSAAPNLYVEGGHDNNKEQSILLCALIMRMDELVAVLVACARQHVFQGAYPRRYKGDGAHFEWDDMADAFFMVMLYLVLRRDADADPIAERLPVSAHTYQRKIDNLFEMARAGFPAHLRYATELIRYTDDGFMVVLPDSGREEPPGLRYLEARVFPRIKQDDLDDLHAGENIVRDIRKQKLDSGSMKTTYRQKKAGASRSAFQRKRAEVEKTVPGPRLPSGKRLIVPAKK
jgi:hypothetical protein